MRRTAPDRWTVIGQSGTPGTGSRLTSIAYCGRGAVPSAASNTVSLAAYRTGSATATCPAGTVVVGGGYKSGASLATLRSCCLVCEATTPTQWRVMLRNIAKFRATALTALAYCGSRSGAHRCTSTTVAMPGEKGGTARASCPAKTSLVFGGL